MKIHSYSFIHSGNMAHATLFNDYAKICSIFFQKKTCFSNQMIFALETKGNPKSMLNNSTFF